MHLMWVEQEEAEKTPFGNYYRRKFEKSFILQQLTKVLQGKAAAEITAVQCAALIAHTKSALAGCLWQMLWGLTLLAKLLPSFIASAKSGNAYQTCPACGPNNISRLGDFRKPCRYVHSWPAWKSHSMCHYHQPWM